MKILILRSKKFKLSKFDCNSVLYVRSMVVNVLQGLLQSGGYSSRSSHPRSQSMQVRQTIKKKKPNVQSKILECIICPNIRNRLMCIYMLNRKKKEKKEKFNRVSSGAASSGAGSPTTASSPEAAGCSRKRRPSWSKFNPTKITSASWHTSSCETTTSKAGTVAGRDHGPRGVRTVRQNLQTEADQAWFHSRRRWPRHGKTLRKRFFPDNDLEVRIFHNSDN